MIVNDIEIAIPSIEVWNTIAQEDIERNQNLGKNVKEKVSENYTTKIYQQIVPTLLQNLLKKGD